MNKFIATLKQFDVLTLTLVGALLVLGVVMLTAALSMHLAEARKRVDPEVTIQARNCYTRTLRVVGDLDYKPFSYFSSKSSEPRGYDIELINEMANRMGVNVELNFMSWNEAVQRIMSQQADLILGCDWQDTAVMDCFFTVPTFEEKFVVFQEKPFKSFSDLYTKKIAVIEGCGLKETLKKYQIWRNCVEYDTVTSCVRAIFAGECDCFIAHNTIGEICLREFGERGKHFQGKLDFASGQMCFGITKVDPVLFAKVNATLIEIRADGTLGELEQKWLEHFVEDLSVINYLRNHPIKLFMTLNLATIVVLIIIIMYCYLIRIRKEKNRAIDAERAKSLFFSTVSHDIRTPLNAIIGFSELLKQGIDDETERKNALEAITTSSNTLLVLVNDILNLSKLETDKMLFNLEPTDMANLGSTVLHSFDISVSNGKTKLVEDFGPLPFLLIDPQRIRQILFNLIGNAVKFTEQGEIRLIIRFEKSNDSEGDTGKLTFSVADTGYGISPENQKKLMQPFVQVHGPSTNKQGTGLGLYICRQFALRMGGDLTLVSERGKGSTFTVTLPKVGFVTERPKEAKEEKHIPLQKTRVLVVDDMPVNRLVTKAMLKRLKVSNITLAANGADALTILLDSPDGFDIVLTDLWMPVMDGKELVQTIRKDERWEKLPVYAVTADTESQGSYKSFGFTGILMKPITMDKLRALLS